MKGPVFVFFSLFFLTTAFSDSYDVFDGKGESKIRIDLIEWEENLQIHTYPSNVIEKVSVQNDFQGAQKVLIIHYHFAHKTETRRALLGIPAKDSDWLAWIQKNNKYDLILLSQKDFKNFKDKNFNFFPIENIKISKTSLKTTNDPQSESPVPNLKQSRPDEYGGIKGPLLEN